MLVMADYVLDADFCLPDGAAPIVIEGPPPGWTLNLSNTTSDPLMAVGVLAARLVFETPSLTEAREIADEYLARALNAACYVTGHSFSYNRLRQIVDWTPGLQMRDLLIYLETPLRETAEPNLTEDFGRSIEHHIITQAGQRQQTALRWFRLGLEARSAEDQFAYFWFALEIAAESLKDKVKVPSSCPHCHSPLYCEECKKHPVHRKYAGQAIQALVEKFVDGDGAEIFRTLQKIRHTLLHGDRISTVIDDLPCSEEEAVNSLSHITQEALGAMFVEKNPNNPGRIIMARRTDVTRKKLVLTTHASVGMGGDPDNPQFDDVPTINVSVTYPAREPGSDQKSAADIGE